MSFKNAAWKVSGEAHLQNGMRLKRENPDKNIGIILKSPLKNTKMSQWFFPLKIFFVVILK